jgi:PAT family beta-lactamase induction signal transducer AmpG
MKAPRHPWLWIPSLYFAEAIPYAMVTFVSRTMYKRLDVSNTEIAFYVGLLGWPWVVKPLWGPLVDILYTKRGWILSTQLILAISLSMMAAAVQLDAFLLASLVVLSVVAFASATHDIAADGFYMLATSSHEQAWYVGIRSTFYRLGWIVCQGLLVVFAGYLERTLDSVPKAWSTTSLVVGGGFALLFVYHALILPRPARDRVGGRVGVGDVAREFGTTFASFFRRRGIGVTLAFLLLYRFAEAQLGAMKSPFFLDPRTAGGLGLTTEQVGWLDGTIGVVMLLVGGILGGWAAARFGLRSCLWVMVLAINVPNLAYVYLATFQPTDFWRIVAAVGIEQFGYGFGFAGYMLYMLYISQGSHETAHYALCTGFMALGIMLPGMFSGVLADRWGYPLFYWWVLVATIPSFIVTMLIHVDPQFGMRTAEGDGPRDQPG